MQTTHINRPPQLSIDLLHTFVCVARSGSINRASAMIGRTQPATSRRIQRLESDVGAELFERLGKRLRLTPAGRGLLDVAVDALAQLRAAESALAGSKTVSGRVVIGTFHSAATHLLAPSLGRVITEYPDIGLSIVLDTEEPLLSRLRLGELDLALLVGESAYPDLSARVLGHDGFVAAVAPKDRRRPLESLRYLAWSGPRDATFAIVDRFARSRGYMTERTPFIPHIETLRRLVGLGHGFSILPAYCVAADVKRKLLAARSIRELDVRVPVTLFHRRSMALGGATRAVRALIEDSASAMPLRSRA